MSDDNTIELVRHLRIMARYEHGDMAISANAADEITRLRAENERLRARIENLEREMRFIGRLDYPPTRLSARDRARAALEAKP
jgi:cell division protein FtsB